jgi:hypothetical protein
MATFYKSDSIPAAVADSLTVPRKVGTLVLNGGKLYRSTSASVATYVIVGNAGMNVTARQIQVQLADLPAGVTTTGTLPLGASIPADTLLIGAFVRLNATTDVGASGITAINVTLGAGGTNIITTLDLLAAPPTAPSYETGATTDYHEMPMPTSLAAIPLYEIVSTGANLDQLVAFDITIYMLVSDLILTAP